MRPIKLKIKGLNSFIEEQTIDFEQLTRQGFFGIFGPTGSGKSTILDGMVLALYGMKAISRGTNEFVNKNCKSAQVSYEFQITGKEVKRYRVEREFKAQEKGTKSGKCKLLDLTEGELVLEETVSGVDKACAEIIGLTADDFMRTVVLPQGKFSEFLKVSGKDRREILERLFRLEEYGVKLEERIGSALKLENTEKTRLSGQAEAYCGYSEEVLREKEVFQKQLAEELSETEQLLKKKKKEMEETEEIWKLQIEEKEREAVLLGLQGRQDEIDIMKAKILLSQRAGQVAAILASVKELEKTETKLEEQLKNAEASFSEWKEKSEQYRIAFENAEQKKEKEESTLIEEVSHAKEALIYWRELPEFYEQKEKNTKEQSSIQQAEQLLAGQIYALDEEKQKLGDLVETLEREVHLQAVSSAYRENVEELVQHESEMIRISGELEEKYLQIKQLEKEISRLRQEEEKLEQQLKELQGEEKQFTERVEEIQILRLRRKLHEGVPCPVCGAMHFEVRTDEKKEESKDEIKLLENVERLKEKIAKMQEKLLGVRGDIQLKQQLSEYTSNTLRQQEEKVNALSEAFQQKMKNRNIDNIREEKEKIRQMDLKREKLEKQLREEKPKQAEVETRIQSFREQQEHQKELAAKLETDRIALEQQIKQRKEEIVRKIGAEKEPEAYLEQQEKNLFVLREMYKAAKDQKEQAEIQMRKCEEIRNNLAGEKKGNRDALSRADEKLRSEMEKQQFTKREEVESALLKEERYRKYTETVETYKKQLHEAEVQLAEIQKKRNMRSVTEEKYVECNKICEKLTKKAEAQKEKHLEIRQEIRKIRENLEIQKEIVKKLEKVEHKIAILEDLKSVTRGKRFVEFMASERLRYISKSASKRLYEITNGSYELEINGEGEFIIRDNKNGGVLRQTATLSGGETFVTSLALALALSAEIQLKGTAPLELFFLDEGFGSLDDTLLDIVMESLEKIHNNQLKVGIISHVESVKARVPVRLMVSPAETGISGSKVKIECL